jgi:hypothetical protein
MQLEGVHIAGTIKLAEYVESKENPLIKVVRTYQYNTNITPFQTLNRFKKSLQRETKHIKT